jgi:hypothetical protein
MPRAVTRNTTWQNLTAFRQKTAQFSDLLIVDMLDFINTKSANAFFGFSSVLSSDQKGSLPSNTI